LKFDTIAKEGLFSKQAKRAGFYSFLEKTSLTTKTQRHGESKKEISNSEFQIFLSVPLWLIPEIELTLAEVFANVSLFLIP
jgi:hypothetical protein